MIKIMTRKIKLFGMIVLRLLALYLRWENLQSVLDFSQIEIRLIHSFHMSYRQKMVIFLMILINKSFNNKIGIIAIIHSSISILIAFH